MVLVHRDGFSDVVEAKQKRTSSRFNLIFLHETKQQQNKMPETKRICVIGASGVVGSHVCQTALRKGYKVRI